MLDGQTHLVKQGWKGAGHPLKAGGRARPIVIAQKKTLGGVGKDRDESFAFWDHLYDVAAKSIKFKIPAEDAESNDEQDEDTSAPIFYRTKTGILSNRRPTALPTPSSSKSPSPPPPSTSLISRAKQEAARRSLYSRFLRGPVITQEALDLESSKQTVETEQSLNTPTTTVASSYITPKCPPPITSQSNKSPISHEDRRIQKAEKAARKQARAERRQAKAVRREARTAKKARKIEEAAKKAVKLERKAEKEKRKHARVLNVEINSEVESIPTSKKSANGERQKKDKKRKRDE